MGPVRVLHDFANRTDCGHTSCQWQCDPGTCGAYSSTNYVIAGLILAHRLLTTISWDATIRGRPYLPTSLGHGLPCSWDLRELFHSDRPGVSFPLIGTPQCHSLTLVCAIVQVSSTIHGYEPAGYKEAMGPTSIASAARMAGPVATSSHARRTVARFFADLLGPLHTNNNDTRAAAAQQFQKGGIVSNASLHAMTRFVQLDPSNVLRYGLGLMEMQYARSTALSLSLCPMPFTTRTALSLSLPASPLHNARHSLTHTALLRRTLCPFSLSDTHTHRSAVCCGYSAPYYYHGPGNTTATRLTYGFHTRVAASTCSTASPSPTRRTRRSAGHMHVPGQTDPIYEATLRVVLGRLAPIPPPDTSKWFIKRGIRCDQALHIGALNTSSQCPSTRAALLSAHLGTALCPSLSLSDSHRSAVCRYCEADQACRIYMYAFHDGKSGGGARDHILHSGSGYDCWVVHNRTESADCLHQDEAYTIGVKRPAWPAACAPLLMVRAKRAGQ